MTAHPRAAHRSTPNVTSFPGTTVAARRLSEACRTMARRFQRTAQRCLREIEYRRTVGALSRLDDRMLRDIGLTRADIHRRAREASGPATGRLRPY